MKYSKIILNFILLLLLNSSFSQGTYFESYEEKVFITSGKNLFVSGETIPISAFCLSTNGDSISHISKVAYVVLINENREVVYKSKLELRSGLGAAEIFVNSAFPTGHYYLMAYTSVMLNQPPEDIYYEEISIVNPFVPYDNPIDTIPNRETTLIPEAGKYSPKTKWNWLVKLADSIATPAKIQVIASNEVFSFDLVETETYLQFPALNEESKVVLTDSLARSYFIDLPLYIENLLTVNYSNNEHQIKIYGEESDELVVLDSNGKVLRSLASTDEIQILDYDLPQGWITFQLKNKNEVIDSVCLYNKGANSISLDEPIPSVLTKRSLVDFSIRSSTESSLSVMIFKKPEHSDLMNNPIGPTFHLSTMKGSASRLKNNFMAETKGELISGTLKKTEESVSFPLEVFVSFSGNNSNLFASTLSSAEDTFRVTIPTNLIASTFIVTSPDCGNCSYGIISKNPQDYQFVATAPLKLDDRILTEITQRSTHAQIEDAYFEVKSVASEEGESIPFYSKADEVFDLNNYTQFLSIEEIFREIVTNVSLRNTDGEYEFTMLREFGNSLSNPLLVIDGIAFKDPKLLIDLDPALLDRIEIVSRKYHLGPTEFNGIISISTKHSDFTLPSIDTFKYVHFNRLAHPNLNSSERIPEYNPLLLWNTNLQLNANESTTLSFETGDTDGTHILSIQGFDKKGNVISFQREFLIE